MKGHRLPDGREAREGSGRSLLEEWVAVHVKHENAGAAQEIVRRLEKALQEIADKRWRGYERSHAQEELRQMREEARASIGLTTNEPNVPRGL